MAVLKRPRIPSMNVPIAPKSPLSNEWYQFFLRQSEYLESLEARIKALEP